MGEWLRADHADVAVKGSRPCDRSLLLLWGFMGSGKSTLGRFVAERAKVPFCDLDEAIARLAGMPIETIFRERGEAHFRQLEAAELRRQLSGQDRKRQLIALGGGALLDESLRCEALRQGFVVSLTATPETIAQRTDGGGRPLLQTDDPQQTIRRLLATRQAAYRSAHEVLPTDARGVDELGNILLARWQGWRGV